ncbi:SDR family NAD(P)-dependent oxidoreductase [Frondihabitans cladoniiphilus]|uniref:SDR family oxidoreductase n=1 Tax=Frondihabitans cladoniiphilus TaxID=715785 RepID=A0ABP8VJH5_9MICO
MDLHLASRTVLVVGGNGYIGRAVVDHLRAEGADVIVASRSGGGDALTLDARDPASVTDGIARAHARNGRLDGLVVTAAPSAQTLDPARSSDPEQVLQAFEGKALTFLRLANAAIPLMREAGFGRIVGISGQNGFLTASIAGSVRNAALAISAKNLADQLAGTGVTVNTIHPGTVTDTPSSTVERGFPGESSPDQIADLVTFFTSPLAVTSGESIAIGHRIRGAVNY